MTGKWIMGTAVLAMCASPAFAQQPVPKMGFSSGYNVQPVAFQSGCCDSCCDSCGDGCCDSCGDCCASDCCDSCCGGGGCGFLDATLGYLGGGCPAPLSLNAFLLGDASAVTVGGWSAWGHYTDDLSAAGAGAFNTDPHRFATTQSWLYAERVADGSNGIDFGFRTDIVYGLDGADTQAFGNPAGSWDFLNGWDHGVYSWALPQLYGEVAMGDFSVKIGHFFTLIGYEVVAAPDNFFFSHARTMVNSEPFTHTGFIGTYTGLELFTLYGGWTAGWDTGFDSLNSGSNFLGGFSTDLLDTVTFTYMCTYGNFGYIGRNAYSHSLLFTFQLTENLQYILQSDLKDIGFNFNIPAASRVSNDDVGINQYLILGWNDILSFGGRFEWWKSDGLSYNNATGGVNIRLGPSLVFRPEIRRDWVPGTGFAETSSAVDMILTF